MHSARSIWIHFESQLNPHYRTGLDTSFPLPVARAGRLFLGSFLHGCARNAQKGSYVSAPQAICFYDAETGELTTEVDAEARLARVAHLPAIGWMHVTFPRQQRAARIDELLALYDVLTPSFQRGVMHPGGAKLAATFSARLADLRPGATPYYEGVVPEFFAWLRAHGKGATHP